MSPLAGHSAWPITETHMLVAIGKGLEITVPAFTDFTPEVQNHIFYIGMRNLLQDAHASITPEKANGQDVQALSREAAERKLAALVRGELRVVGARETDPVKAEALRIITGAIKKKYQGQKVEEKEIRAKARDFLNTPSPALDKIMLKAKKNVKEAADIDIEV